MPTRKELELEIGSNSAFVQAMASLQSQKLQAEFDRQEAGIAVADAQIKAGKAERESKARIAAAQTVAQAAATRAALDMQKKDQAQQQKAQQSGGQPIPPVSTTKTPFENLDVSNPANTLGAGGFSEEDIISNLGSGAAPRQGIGATAQPTITETTRSSGPVDVPGGFVTGQRVSTTTRPNVLTPGDVLQAQIAEAARRDNFKLQTAVIVQNAFENKKKDDDRIARLKLSKQDQQIALERNRILWAGIAIDGHKAETARLGLGTSGARQLAQGSLNNAIFGKAAGFPVEESEIDPGTLLGVVRDDLTSMTSQLIEEKGSKNPWDGASPGLLTQIIPDLARAGHVIGFVAAGSIWSASGGGAGPAFFTKEEFFQDINEMKFGDKKTSRAAQARSESKYGITVDRKGNLGSTTRKVTSRSSQSLIGMYEKILRSVTSPTQVPAPANIPQVTPEELQRQQLTQAVTSNTNQEVLRSLRR